MVRIHLQFVVRSLRGSLNGNRKGDRMKKWFSARIALTIVGGYFALYVLLTVLGLTVGCRAASIGCGDGRVWLKVNPFFPGQSSCQICKDPGTAKILIMLGMGATDGYDHNFHLSASAL